MEGTRGNDGLVIAWIDYSVVVSTRANGEESKSWAGLAVEVTKGIEARMTKSQQLASHWRYSWKKNSSIMWLQRMLPFLFVAILTPFVARGAWVLISRSKSKAPKGFKYGCILLSLIVIVSTASGY
eukprot:Gb_15778 [translate_table: standard]